MRQEAEPGIVADRRAIRKKPNLEQLQTEGPCDKKPNLEQLQTEGPCDKKPNLE
jgi:hypothetical protein